ncbi:putative uncharacterized protein DDB_G0285495 [Papaver somniferum]|uniref:putative uncharacterized protein DDB_G0285495 n=1 Tax=Papaver somniferum TaxID=3469 RepID=UPI000E6FEC30|nr:putative uncharacterized protein DDB_G0285495 [Papaver somniferum]
MESNLETKGNSFRRRKYKKNGVKFGDKKERLAGKQGGNESFGADYPPLHKIAIKISYGAEYPSLQKIAVKILSQTNTSSGSKRNWSVFERIHTKLRNRLLSSRINDLVYVQYNLKLEQQRIKGKARRHNIDVHDVHSLPRDDNMLDWIAGEDKTPVLPQEEQLLNMLEEEAVNNPKHVPLPYNWHDPEVQISYERLPVSDFVYDFGCTSDRSDHGVQHMNEGYNSNIDNNNEVGNNDDEGGYDDDNEVYYDDDTYANEDSQYPHDDDYDEERNRRKNEKYMNKSKKGGGRSWSA